MEDEDAKARAQNKKAVKEQKVQDESIDSVLRELTKLPEGKAFIWWLLQIGKFGEVPFTGNALTSYFMAGELNIGMQVYERVMRASPEGFLEMMKDHFLKVQVKEMEDAE